MRRASRLAKPGNRGRRRSGHLTTSETAALQRSTATAAVHSATSLCPAARIAHAGGPCRLSQPQHTYRKRHAQRAHRRCIAEAAATAVPRPLAAARVRPPLPLPLPLAIPLPVSVPPVAIPPAAISVPVPISLPPLCRGLLIPPCRFPAAARLPALAVALPLRALPPAAAVKAAAIRPDDAFQLLADVARETHAAAVYPKVPAPVNGAARRLPRLQGGTPRQPCMQWVWRQHAHVSQLEDSPQRDSWAPSSTNNRY